MLLIGALATTQFFDHKQVMDTKHAEASHYSEVSQRIDENDARLDRHAQAIKKIYCERQEPKNGVSSIAPKDDWLERL